MEGLWPSSFQQGQRRGCYIIWAPGPLLKSGVRLAPVLPSPPSPNTYTYPPVRASRQGRTAACQEGRGVSWASSLQSNHARLLATMPRRLSCREIEDPSVRCWPFVNKTPSLGAKFNERANQTIWFAKRSGHVLATSSVKSLKNSRPMMLCMSLLQPRQPSSFQDSVHPCFSSCRTSRLPISDTIMRGDSGCVQVMTTQTQYH